MREKQLEDRPSYSPFEESWNAQETEPRDTLLRAPAGYSQAVFEHKLRQRWARRQQVCEPAGDIFAPEGFAAAEEMLRFLVAESDWENQIRRPIYLENQKALFKKSKTTESKGRVGDIIGDIIKGLHGIFEKWGEYKDASARARAIETLVKNVLKNIGIPGVEVKDAPDLPARASFIPEAWKIIIAGRLLSEPLLGADEKIDFCHTLAHEIRHAEQWFREAQAWAAGRKGSRVAKQLSTRQPRIESIILKIPRDIAGDAVKRARDKAGDAVKRARDKDDEKYFSNIVNHELTESQIEGNKNDGTVRLKYLRDTIHQHLRNMSYSPSGYDYYKTEKLKIEQDANKLKNQMKLVEKWYRDYLSIPLEIDADQAGSIAAHAYQDTYFPAAQRLDI